MATVNRFDMNPPAIAQPAQQVRALATIEAELEHGRKMAKLEEGRLLKEIRDGGQYKEQYGTFEKYCLQRWGMKRRTAYYRIELFEDAMNPERNVQNLHTIPLVEPDEEEREDEFEKLRELESKLRESVERGKRTEEDLTRILKPYVDNGLDIYELNEWLFENTGRELEEYFNFLHHSFGDSMLELDPESATPERRKRDRDLALINMTDPDKGKCTTCVTLDSEEAAIVYDAHRRFHDKQSLSVHVSDYDYLVAIQSPEVQLEIATKKAELYKRRYQDGTSTAVSHKELIKRFREEYGQHQLRSIEDSNK